MKKYEQLIDLNFTEIGFWKTDDEDLDFEVYENKYNEFEIDNSLYVFFDSEKDKILYVGKTTQTLKKRFYGYIRGNGQSTNSKIHNKLVKEKSGKILILSLNDDLPFNWGIYNLNLAAGLEDSIIELEEPEWNGRSSETEMNEKSLITDHSEINDKFFIVSLSKTYFKIGSINVPLKKSDLLGKHEDIITIELSKDNKQITTQINRNAVKNRSVRINQNKEIKEYYNKFYNMGDKVKITIADEGNLIIE
jgi:hypothetical protein